MTPRDLTQQQHHAERDSVLTLGTGLERRQRGARLRWYWRFGAWLLSWLVRLLLGTLRVEIRGAKAPSRPFIYAFRHGQQLSLLRYPRPDRVTLLASLSRDGSIQNHVMRRFGFEVIRGSSSRGGAAGLLALIRAARSGSSIAMAVDGPRGPEGVVKKGVLAVAKSSRLSILPLVSAASSRWCLRKSWDKFEIPKPWSRVVIICGSPISIPERVDEGELLAFQRQLQANLDDLVPEVRRIAQN